jgi:hypothetical protein
MDVADPTYDKAKRKLLKTYGTPEWIRVKSMKDVKEAFHARMCEAAEEQCGRWWVLPAAGMAVEI